MSVITGTEYFFLTSARILRALISPIPVKESPLDLFAFLYDDLNTRGILYFSERSDQVFCCFTNYLFTFNNTRSCNKKKIT